MILPSLLVLALALAPVLAQTGGGPGAPTACVSFDTSWNMLAFGFGGKDYSLGQQDTWASSSPAPVDITTSGRPYVPLASSQKKTFGYNYRIDHSTSPGRHVTSLNILTPSMF